MIKAVCKNCRAMNINKMNIKLGPNASIKTNCKQCGKDVIFKAKAKKLDTK